MSDVVTGNNMNLYYHRVSDNTDILFACARNCQMVITQTFKDVTNYTSAFYKQVKPDIAEWSVSGEGLVVLSNYSYLDITTLQQNRSSILIKFVVDNGSGGLVIYSGSVYIGNITLVGNYNSQGVYSFQLVGSGPWNSTGTQVTPTGITVQGGTVTRFEAIKSGDGTTIVIPATIGASVITVFARGTAGTPRIIYTGAPTGDQILFTTSNGTFTTASDNPFLDTEELWGNFK